MASDSVASYLAEHPFFKGLDKEQLKVLASAASTVQFDAAQVIFRQQQPAENFYLIRTGKISVEIPSIYGPPIVIQNLKGGDVLGWSWLFPPHQWHFDARAVEPSKLLALDGKWLRQKIDEDHDLGFELLKRFARVMVERMQAARMQMIEKCSEP